MRETGSPDVPLYFGEGLRRSLGNAAGCEGGRGQMCTELCRLVLCMDVQVLHSACSTGRTFSFAASLSSSALRAKSANIAFFSSVAFIRASKCSGAQYCLQYQA